jgi:lipoprotein-anchoring transpeptidase ErfK/SrfK
MHFAILIMGDRGIYIHEGDDTIATNGGESAGCIHLAPGNAEAFWNWVSGPTRITIDYPW